MKKTVLINRAVYLPGEGGYKRTMYLFDMMYKMDKNPILLTSDFNHYKKQARNIKEFQKAYPEYNHIIDFIHTPVYSKNISFKRYFAEKVWTRGVKKWVREHANEIDKVMLDMPDMNTILAIQKICQKHQIKMIVDVRDLRPEAFRVIVKNERLYRILFYGMRKKADRAYACADELVAVSEEYLARGLKCNTKAKDPVAVYIGSAMERFDKGVQEFSDSIDKPQDEIWLTYAGTLGTSYDLRTLISAAKKVQEKTDRNIRVKILGQGPEEAPLKGYAKQIGADNVDFMGFLDYEVMAAYLSKSDITVNAIKKNASQSIINKIADYFAAGIPILNGCTCKEMQDMVANNQVGLNYIPENVDDLVEKIVKLISNPDLCKQYGCNAARFAREKFDRKTSYLEIIKRIDNL